MIDYSSIFFKLFMYIKLILKLLKFLSNCKRKIVSLLIKFILCIGIPLILFLPHEKE